MAQHKSLVSAFAPVATVIFLAATPPQEADAALIVESTFDSGKGAFSITFDDKNTPNTGPNNNIGVFETTGTLTYSHNGQGPISVGVDTATFIFSFDQFFIEANNIPGNSYGLGQLTFFDNNNPSGSFTQSFINSTTLTDALTQLPNFISTPASLLVVTNGTDTIYNDAYWEVTDTNAISAPGTLVLTLMAGFGLAARARRGIKPTAVTWETNQPEPVATPL